MTRLQIKNHGNILC